MVQGNLLRGKRRAALRNASCVQKEGLRFPGLVYSQDGRGEDPARCAGGKCRPAALRPMEKDFCPESFTGGALHYEKEEAPAEMEEGARGRRLSDRLQPEKELSQGRERREVC